MNDRQCTTCGKIGSTIQSDLFGGPKVCFDCLSKARVAMMLKVLPTAEDDEWENLTEWEQEFLPSVRNWVARKGTLTEAQYHSLEQVWKKHN